MSAHVEWAFMMNFSVAKSCCSQIVHSKAWQVLSNDNQKIRFPNSCSQIIFRLAYSVGLLSSSPLVCVCICMYVYVFVHMLRGIWGCVYWCIWMYICTYKCKCAFGMGVNEYIYLLLYMHALSVCICVSL